MQQQLGSPSRDSIGKKIFFSHLKLSLFADKRDIIASERE